MTETRGALEGTANGAAKAAILAAGIGAFVIGLLAVFDHTGVYAAPEWYGPTGQLSGRTGIASIIWLVAWAALHRRWAKREIDGRRVDTLAFMLIALGVIMTFPPLWSLL